MCNTYLFRLPEDEIRDAFSVSRIPLRWAEGQASNLPPLDDIRIRDLAPVVGLRDDAAELSMTRWAWLGPGGKPVFNFRSDGRRFGGSERRLIPAEGFYEFTAPADTRQKRKDKWLFTLKGNAWFWIAGIVKDGCFTMLTTEPGPDMRPFHDRQVVVLPRDMGLAWLTLSEPEHALLRPLPAGSLEVTKIDALSAA